ncbi:aminopeptidase [Paenibacillus montaniterrae]|uniref:Aminopeptidase n=1 Tax=Paenibacillus montaniterrae TaxID=429341 RepID=A0A919YK97_9BACL|nr:aminopeptidase [Paenibacillus montaniterrae]GIP14847.1 aminopeptidase [Paenibacillus montaniterrae]
MSISKPLQLKLERYIELLLKRGVALQPQQLLVITCNSENLYFAKMIAAQAYKLGAGDVQLRLEDEELEHARLLHSQPEHLRQYYELKQHQQASYEQRGACFLRCLSPNPSRQYAVPQQRQRLVDELLASLAERTLTQQFSFPVRRHASPAATASWARVLFPHLDEQEAFEALWQHIFHITYCDDEANDPLLGWDQHIKQLLATKERLNALPITRLHFRNSLGTDLTIELADGAQWYGGSVTGADGITFYPSIPTEEIFTAPHRAKVEGVVYSSMPLLHEGGVIDQFYLRFSKGKVLEWGAETGASLLAALLEKDEGASRLGEVALVHSQSRIAKSNILHYETLCDENRTCHVALGTGYPGCLKQSEDGRSMLERGLNASGIHVDFMFGTEDMTVTAHLADGAQLELMQQGRFVGL